MVSPLYDVYLGSHNDLRPYRLGGQFVRDSAPLISPRFSTGRAGETDLDLLKSVSLSDLAGGMFQRNFVDPRKAARVAGLYNPRDGYVYPSPGRTAQAAITAGYFPVARAEGSYVGYVAYGAELTPINFTSQLFESQGGGGFTNIASLPAGIAANGQTYITDLVFHKGHLFVFCNNYNGGPNIYRYASFVGTWQDLGSASQVGFTLRNTLYTINPGSDIYSITNELAAGAATFTFVTRAGQSDSFRCPPRCAVEFNGAVYISKLDGIFRFDGTNATKLLNYAPEQMYAWNGALYFAAGQTLFRFDGTTLTRLHYFGVQENLNRFSLSSNDDYLFVSTSVRSSASYANEDDPLATSNRKTRLYVYDGVGFFLQYQDDRSTSSENTFTPFLIFIRTTLYNIVCERTGTGTGDWQSSMYSFLPGSTLIGSSFAKSDSMLQVVTSEFDDDFPGVFKSAEFVEGLYADLDSSDFLDVYFRINDGVSWSTWTLLGTLTSSTPPDFEFVDFSSKLFKRIQWGFILRCSNGSTTRFRASVLRYTLQQRMRWRWQALLLAVGNGLLEKRDGTSIDDDSNKLNNFVVQSIKQKTPSYFLSPDYAFVKTQVDSAALSFVALGQLPLYADPYGEYPLVAALNHSGVWEILRVSNVSYNAGTDETTITVLERGYLGIVNAQIDAGAQVRLCFKVYVTRLLRDSVILDESTYAQQKTTGESQLQHEFLLELTEV